MLCSLRDALLSLSPHSLLQCMCVGGGMSGLIKQRTPQNSKAEDVLTAQDLSTNPPPPPLPQGRFGIPLGQTATSSDLVKKDESRVCPVFSSSLRTPYLLLHGPADGGCSC